MFTLQTMKVKAYMKCMLQSTNKTRKKFYLEYRLDNDKSSQKMVFDNITSAVQFYNIIVSRAINEYDCTIAMINHMNF